MNSTAFNNVGKFEVCNPLARAKLVQTPRGNRGGFLGTN